MANLTEFIAYHAMRAPTRTALIYQDREISYGDLLARAESAAAWLERVGVRPGDVVALWMKNSAAFIDLVLAISHRGAVVLPLNYRLAVNEITYILADAGAKVLIADDEFADLATPLEREAVQRLYLLDDAAQADIRAFTGFGRSRAARREASDLMRLVYTSGTTSRPKGVIHAYDQFYWKHLSFIAPLDLNAATRLLTVGPLYHVGGLELPGMSVLALGGVLAIERMFDPERALDAISRHRLNGAWLAPTMTNMILALPPARWADGAGLDWVIGGGERTPEARILSFAEAFPNARYIDAYGLTESNSGDTFMEAGRELEKIGSVGRAVPHLEVEIRDDDGQALEAGTSGEICLRGPKVTPGYWNDPRKTAEAFFPDGWLRTGDIGHLDGEGFLYLTDRKKDMILSGGENIASSEVERALYEMPAVLEAAVVAAPHPKWGEAPVAVITPRPGATVTLADVEAHCADALGRFKTPKALVIKSELPRNPSGKVLKRILRDEILKEAGLWDGT